MAVDSFDLGAIDHRGFTRIKEDHNATRQDGTANLWWLQEKSMWLIIPYSEQEPDRRSEHLKPPMAPQMRTSHLRMSRRWQVA